MAFVALLGFSTVLTAKSHDDYSSSDYSSSYDSSYDSSDECDDSHSSEHHCHNHSILTPVIYQNPFMAPNNFSEVHCNAFQTDTVSVRGPDKSAEKHTHDFLLDPPTVGSGTSAFNSKGQIVYLRTGENINTLPIQPLDSFLMLLDQDTFQILDSIVLPNRVPAIPVAYFYIDNLDRVVIPVPNQDIRIYSIVNNHYVLVKTYSLASTLNNPADIIVSVLPDNVGNLWFISQLGVVGYIQSVTEIIFATNLASSGGTAAERIAKSFATDEDGGVYPVSTFAQYRFQVGPLGAPIAVWRTTYDRGTRVKSGQPVQGSGTTPTLFNDFVGNKFVTIGDNADPYMHVNVYNRANGALVAQQAVFTRFPYANSCFNSLIAVNHSVIIENNYGSTGAGLATTAGTLTTVPGLARVDFNPNTNTSEVVWTNYDISVPSAVSRLSTGNGLIYTYVKGKGWYFAAVDYITGLVCKKAQVAPTGILADNLANNFFSNIAIGPDKSAHITTIGGITVWRDSHHHH